MPFPLPTDLHEWVYAIQVSRRWREIALSTPNLWNQIHLNDNSVERALEYLRRSKTIPFKLYFTGTLPGESPDETGASMYNTLLEITFDTPRLQELHLQSAWARNSCFWDLMDRPAPTLESISNEVEIEDTEDAVSVLPRIFNDDMPRLKNVYLSNVSAWPYNRFRNLVRFHLYDQPTDARPNLITFLQVLEANSETLQELVLVRAGPTHYSLEEGKDIYEAALPVVLPALRYIEVGDREPWHWSGDHLRLLFSHIIIPPTTKCCFYERYQYLAPSEYFFQTGEGRPLPTVRKLVLTSFETTANQASMVRRVGSTFYANFIWDRPDFVLQSNDTDFLKDVQELVYAPGTYYDASFDEQIFEALPSLHTLRVAEELCTKLHRLWDLLRKRNEDAPEPTFKYAHRLENLHIYSDAGRTGYYETRDVGALIETANIRLLHGHPLREVVEDHFPTEQSERLGKRFEKVIFIDSNDGDETGVTRDDILPLFWGVV